MTGYEESIDDQMILCRAARRAIAEKFDRLSKNQQNAVFGKIYDLAGRPQTTDFEWGEHHAFDDVLRWPWRLSNRGDSIGVYFFCLIEKMRRKAQAAVSFFFSEEAKMTISTDEKPAN